MTGRDVNEILADPNWECSELGHLYEAGARAVCAQCGAEREPDIRTFGNVPEPATSWVVYRFRDQRGVLIVTPCCGVQTWVEKMLVTALCSRCMRPHRIDALGACEEQIGEAA